MQTVRGVLVWCTGLIGAKLGEKVYFEQDQVGIVDGIGPKLTVVMLFDSRNVELGGMVVRSGQKLMAQVSNDACGRVLDVFGSPLDGRGQLTNLFERELDAAALPLVDRVRVNENLETGVTIVDLLIPIGKGQRQLVMGDQKTGKTSFLLQLIARQVSLGNVCIYASIGKRQDDIVSVVDRLKKLNAFEKTVVISAPASSPASIIYLSPFYAFALAEHFRDIGRDVVLVLDEITIHARYYRELSILSRKMPGREGYPGDIFYLHAHLMERAGRFLIDLGKKAEETISLKIKGPTATITCLPVVETQGGDITGFIATNSMAMTDGHIFFDVNRYQQGFRPAVNTRLSVTRVGKQTQKTIEREFANHIRSLIFDYSRAQDVAKFGVELLEATQRQLAIGEKLEAVLDQSNEVIIPRFLQLLYLALLLTGFWENRTIVQVKADKNMILSAWQKGYLAKLEKELVNALELGSSKRFSEKVASVQAQILAICELKKI